MLEWVGCPLVWVWQKGVTEGSCVFSVKWSLRTREVSNGKTTELALFSILLHVKAFRGVTPEFSSFSCSSHCGGGSRRTRT